MGGVAEVVVGVAVRLVEGEGADDDGESFEGFERVGGAAFAGNDALDVGFDGEGDREDEFAIAGGDVHGIVQGKRFAVGREGEGAGKFDRIGEVIRGEGKFTFMRLDIHRSGERGGSAGFGIAEAEGCGSFGCW